MLPFFSTSNLLMWFIEPVQNFGYNTFAPRFFKSSITNGQRCKTLFRENRTRCSMSWTEHPISLSSKAERRPQGPAPMTQTWNMTRLSILESFFFAKSWDVLWNVVKKWISLRSHINYVLTEWTCRPGPRYFVLKSGKGEFGKLDW